MWINCELLWKACGSTKTDGQVKHTQAGDLLLAHQCPRLFLNHVKLTVMAGAGYSGTPLVKKPGITPSLKIQLVNAPGNYFELLETNISHQLVQANETPDLVHVFVTTNTAFEGVLKKIKPLCKTNTAITIWVSWYKKSAGIATDVTEDVIRAYALKNDLVDIKVCAVSDLWSGLKLVVPVARR